MEEEEEEEEAWLDGQVWRVPSVHVSFHATKQLN